MPANIQTNKLFLAARIALIATAMTFAFRAALEGVWGNEFHLTKEQVGWIFAPAFWGFTLAMIFGGPLCDILGMKRLLGHCFSLPCCRSNHLFNSQGCYHAFYRDCFYWHC
jgi:MFS family permease